MPTANAPTPPAPPPNAPSPKRYVLTGRDYVLPAEVAHDALRALFLIQEGLYIPAKSVPSEEEPASDYPGGFVSVDPSSFDDNGDPISTTHGDGQAQPP